ncbi:MAG: phosphoglucosamine mutase [Clostridiales bacterium 43-6]|nr:MAG: phosphoglucosamine mutase [Clostridiales bacterium 43-6]
MGRLFGTDGARGIANEGLSCETSMNIGRAAAMVLASHCTEKPKVLIGKDTRISSDMLENALVAGLLSVGADVILVGVVPTPATAYLIRHYGADAGIMISASHNPCEYNGIKLFDGNGYKLPDTLEEEIEGIVLDRTREIPSPTGGDIGRVVYEPDASDIYIEHLKSTVDVSLSGLKVALDCANGSSAVTAEKLFKALGADCYLISNKPNGININENCGSTHMGNLIEFVMRSKMDLGLAFDGDADRCLAVDSEGNLIDGDKMIAIAAKDMKDRGVLAENTAVMTVMSNLGFFHFAKANGIKVEVTKVGDRYVLEEMRKSGYIIGGEQSGHIIYLEHASTGDGQLSGIQLMAIMKRTGKTLNELGSVMDSFPQVLVNIKTTNEIKAKYENDESVKAAIRDASDILGEDGRVLVRASGTEPLIRVMLEGKDEEQITALANSIADVIKSLT